MGISANVTFSQKAFADFLKLNYPLLSDSDGQKVMQAYGVLDPEQRRAKRSYFIIDKQGIIRFKRLMPSNRELMDNEELLAVIRKINQGS